MSDSDRGQKQLNRDISRVWGKHDLVDIQVTFRAVPDMQMHDHQTRTTTTATEPNLARPSPPNAPSPTYAYKVITDASIPHACIKYPYSPLVRLPRVHPEHFFEVQRPRFTPETEKAFALTFERQEMTPKGPRPPAPPPTDRSGENRSDRDRSADASESSSPSRGARSYPDSLRTPRRYECHPRRSRPPPTVASPASLLRSRPPPEQI